MTMQTRVNPEVRPGTPHRMGAHFDGEGTNFAVFSAHASRVDLCLFTPDGETETARVPLPERSGDTWHGYVPGLAPGTLYGFRVDGPYTPDRGHRFNPNKLLLDPYTREMAGGFIRHRALYGYKVGNAGADMSYDGQDSAPYVPKAVISDPETFPMDATRLGRNWSETLIYEAHVKGATMRHPDVPKEARGTYDGMASDAMLDHLTRLGVTAVELLPVHALKSEDALLSRSLVNYWGYNTVGFFAPEPRYFGPEGVAGFRKMVDRFHAAGIEVLLDVVYNHSAEGDHLGPTLSFRGLDNASYYRLAAGEPRYYVNDTGTGNTLNVSHPQVLRLVMDSLRFWVQAMGVDGFRFDLATTVAREAHGFDRSGSFLDALRQDPVLAGVKLIAEPWDIGPGGYQLGQFPPEFAEWNDKYPRQPSAASGGGIAMRRRIWGPRCWARRSCSTSAGGGHGPRSTTRPRTTATRWPIAPPTSSATTTPTARATATATTPIIPRISGWRGAPTIPPSSPRGGSGCATFWQRSSSRRGCR